MSHFSIVDLRYLGSNNIFHVTWYMFVRVCAPDTDTDTEPYLYMHILYYVCMHACAYDQCFWLKVYVRFG